MKRHPTTQVRRGFSEATADAREHDELQIADLWFTPGWQDASGVFLRERPADADDFGDYFAPRRGALVGIPAYAGKLSVFLSDTQLATLREDIDQLVGEQQLRAELENQIRDELAADAERAAAMGRLHAEEIGRQRGQAKWAETVVALAHCIEMEKGPERIAELTRLAPMVARAQERLKS
jgi:hypothetical protein